LASSFVIGRTLDDQYSASNSKFVATSEADARGLEKKLLVARKYTNPLSSTVTCAPEKEYERRSGKRKAGNVATASGRRARNESAGYHILLNICQISHDILH
jgi:hypothetical protein